tara:strand:+ start:489 stop:755 length:267 start_codon:yes stop_codon:yes gene_type:complete
MNYQLIPTHLGHEVLLESVKRHKLSSYGSYLFRLAYDDGTLDSESYQIIVTKIAPSSFEVVDLSLEPRVFNVSSMYGAVEAWLEGESA